MAEAYAHRFSDELDAKPFDRGILARFAGMVADGGRVLDAGCGPGHIAAHLNGLGLAVTGLDLSTRMLEVARRRVPGGEFVHGNMLALPQPDGSFAGCVAMYSLHHLARTDLPRALAEIRRVLAADAPFLLALHCGHGRVRADHFLDHPVAIDGFLYLPERVAALLATAGFAVEAVERRPPYRGIEAPYERVYALSRAA